jgi:hypothetical protein
VQPEEAVDVGGIVVRAVPAMHGVTMEDAFPPPRAGRGCGDAPDQRARPEREGRNIVGNLSEREAAWPAYEIRAGLLIPMHHDMFAHNRGYPAHVVESVGRDHPGTAVLVPVRNIPFLHAAARPS